MTFFSKSAAFRKKSIPAPIMILDADHLMPKVQIGHSAVLTGVPLPGSTQPNADDAPVNPPSPSASDNLSSISGTTLARALIGSSFVLSSCERRSSRHRNGVVRQDSATLPRGSFFLSDSESSSPAPPVPPVPAVLVSLPDPNSSVIKSASTDSEYPMSDSHITSPATINSVVPQRISRIQEIPSPISSSTNAPPPVTPDMTPHRTAGPFPSRTPGTKDAVFDVPKTALPINSQEITQHSSQEGSPFLLGHSLDEFDFLPPEPLVMVASPDSDSSASYIAPIAPLPKRLDSNRGQRKRRIGGSGLIRNCCMMSSFSLQV